MLDNGKAEGARKIKQIEKYCLRDIAIVSQGFTFSRSYQGKKNLKWNYFKVADIGINPNSKYLTNAINTISDITMEEIGALPFPKGSIVFPRVGAALFNNNKKILAQDGVVDDNVLVLTVTDTSKCWYEFLYYYLQGIPLAKWCNSGLVPVINTKTVLSQMVFLPPLPEQQKIAAILSTQDKVIELKEKLLAQKQQQKKYLMQQLLMPKNKEKSFKSIHLSDISRLIKKHVDGQKFNYVSTENISPNLSGKALFDESNIEISGVGFNAGDILVGNIRPYLKKVWRANKDGLCSTDVLVFRPIGISSEFLYYLIANDNFFFNVMTTAKGSKMPRGDKKAIMNAKMLIPESRIEQNFIVEILSTADHEINLLQESIEAEKQKKKALMQLLLTEKVRVKCNG